MWDLIVSVPDHCLSFYLEPMRKIYKLDKMSRFSKMFSLNCENIFFLYQSPNRSPGLYT